MTKWLSFICRQHYCWDQSAYPPSSNEPFSGDGLCGISACKVYPQIMLPSLAVSSYLTFSTSPLPSPQVEREKQLFSVALSVAPFSPRHPALHRCIALCCPDFPPSRQRQESDNPACS